LKPHQVRGAYRSSFVKYIITLSCCPILRWIAQA
jgi:hypothetical protein